MADEALVGINGLWGDAEDIDAQLRQPVGVIAVGAELARTDRREVAGVEGQDHADPLIIRKPVGPFVRSRKREIRSALAEV